MLDWIVDVDFRILDGIQETFKSGFLDWFLPKVTMLGEKGWIYIVIAVVFLLIPRYRKWGWSLAFGLLFGLVFGNLIIKNAVGRVRPYDRISDFTLLVEPLTDFSFPSGHTMAAFEFLAVVCCMPVNRVYKLLAVLFSLVMAFSRLYLYVHFPSDVLMGAILGTLFGMCGVFLAKRIYKKNGIEKTIKS